MKTCSGYKGTGSQVLNNSSVICFHAQKGIHCSSPAMQGLGSYTEGVEFWYHATPELSFSGVYYCQSKNANSPQAAHLRVAHHAVLQQDKNCVTSFFAWSKPCEVPTPALINHLGRHLFFSTDSVFFFSHFLLSFLKKEIVLRSMKCGRPSVGRPLGIGIGSQASTHPDFVENP